MSDTRMSIFRHGGYLPGLGLVYPPLGCDVKVTVTEVWDKPTRAAPSGRLTVYGGGEVLADGCWPALKATENDE